MPHGTCIKCGRRTELALESYCNPVSAFLARSSGQDPDLISGACSMCSDALDRQWKGTPATDWVLTDFTNERYIYRCTPYDLMKSHWATHTRPNIRPATSSEVAGNDREMHWAMQLYDEETRIWARWGFFWDYGEEVEPLDGVWDDSAKERFRRANEEIKIRMEELGHRPETRRFEHFLKVPDAVSNTDSPNIQRGLANLAGMTELKELLMHEVLGPMRHPELYRRYRISLPNGILFYGPPGCGKTYVARCLAEELGWHFQYCRPSDVASPYIHDTVLKIRGVFDKAIEKAPSIVFIDEFEAFAPSRSGLAGHQQYKAEEVNEFLANLEGCAERSVLVIAATNEPDKIDSAVRRSGRFDKLIFIPPPDADARESMIELHLHGRPVEVPIGAREIAAVLDGYSASDIKLLVDESARIALKRAEVISTRTILDALDRVPASITGEMLQKYAGMRSRGV